jgi:hypothetical protein
MVEGQWAYVGGLRLRENLMEQKIARICWNSNKWVSPSGKKGKSLDTNSFEYTRGFGHEEWLFDFSKDIGGFKYSFLQPVNTLTKKHQGQEYSVWLYTQKDGEKLCIGYIKHVYCLTEEEAQLAIKVHQNNGWYDEMKGQLETYSINTTGLIDEDALNNFNIKFAEQDLVLFSEPIDITKQYGNNRYVLMSLVDSKFKDYHILGDDLVFDLAEINELPLSDSEKELLIKARVGQGKFRKNVIREWGGEKCSVTLVDIKEMLIASHIKAWKFCSNTTERLDGANGIMLCAHIDKLFDNYLVTFREKRGQYDIEFSNGINIKTLKSLGIEKGYGLNTNDLSADAVSRFKGYMNFHNEQFDKKDRGK